MHGSGFHAPCRSFKVLVAPMISVAFTQRLTERIDPILEPGANPSQHVHVRTSRCSFLLVAHTDTFQTVHGGSSESCTFPECSNG